MLGRRWPPQEAGVARGLLSCIFAPILQDAAAVPIVSVGIIVCNTHGNVFSCKFSCILGNGGVFLPVSLVFRQSAPVVAAVCRMGGAWSWRACCRRWSSAVSRLAPNMGRRATPLPSPPLGGVYVSAVLCLPSLVVVVVCCWWLLLAALYDDLRQVAGVCDMVRYYITFNRARNKRARTRRGETCIKHFPASLRHAGGVLGVSEGGVIAANI
nr:MAG TPA: hypothetical protein [Caudoviricetes sp.]